MTENHEEEIKNLIKKMQQQQQIYTQHENTNNIINRRNTLQEQKIPQNINNNSFQQAPPPQPVQHLDTCPQCNKLHPPLRPGEECPMKPISEEKTGGVSEQKISNYLVSLRNIIISNISKKQIKDGDKFFKYTILEITKIVEKYNE